MKATPTKAEKEPEFPYTVTVPNLCGISATVYKQTQEKNGTCYESYVVSYNLLGKRKQQRCSDFNVAVAAGEAAIKQIANGEQLALQLQNGDRLVYLRAKEVADPLGLGIDVMCRDHAEILKALDGKATPIEAIRFYLKANDVETPKVLVAVAVQEMISQAERDGKSEERIHQISTYLNRFKESFGTQNVTDLTTTLISDFLVHLDVKERTKKNCRDVLTAFCNWCVGRGYLPKGTDLMEHVQTYRNRKLGEIQIFTPEELNKMIVAARDEILPYIVIQAFAGIRGKEIQRLDWSDIDLADGFIQVRGEAAKTDVRRLVPIKPNLLAWLQPRAKKSGAVCPFKNMSNELTDLSEAAKVEWKKNGLRHSYISYRTAECADLPRVADESGNSVAVIKTNYLKRVKPAQASEWFAIMPAGEAERQGKIAQMPKRL